ncbi:hypothetical protein V2J09_011270 [Rumex salicifolius]
MSLSRTSLRSLETRRARLKGATRKLVSSPSQWMITLERWLCKELEDVLHQEQVLWFQKSQANFLIDGDLNTRFYHLFTIVRRRYNKILILKNEDGVWISNQPSLFQLVLNFFLHFYLAEMVYISVVPTYSVTFPTLEAKMISDLARSFYESEVSTALKLKRPYKAPAPMVIKRSSTNTTGIF